MTNFLKGLVYTHPPPPPGGIQLTGGTAVLAMAFVQLKEMSEGASMIILLLTYFVRRCRFRPCCMGSRQTQESSRDLHDMTARINYAQ
jgi:hypothetical protein